MSIEKIADGIEQAKLGYMEAVCERAERANAELKAAMFDRVAEKGIPCEGGAPGFIAVSAACSRCYDEDSHLLPVFGAAKIEEFGSICAFSCNTIQAALRMRTISNEFTVYLRAVAAFDQQDSALSENRQGD